MNSAETVHQNSFAYHLVRLLCRPILIHARGDKLRMRSARLEKSGPTSFDGAEDK